MSYFIVDDYPDEELVVYGPFPTWESAAEYVKDYYWLDPLIPRIARLEDTEPWWCNDDIEQSRELDRYLATEEQLELESKAFDDSEAPWRARLGIPIARGGTRILKRADERPL